MRSSTLCLLVCAFLGEAAAARHGSNYPGPFPPGGPVPGGGTTPQPPNPPGPSGPSGPSAPSPVAPITPASTGTPAPASVPTGIRPGRAQIPTDGSIALEATSWEFWWVHNRHAYLDLKQRVDSRAPSTQGAIVSADERMARGLDALSVALGREKQRDLVSSLLIALARSADDGAAARASEMVRAVQPFVANPDQEIGETAAASLGILRNIGGLTGLAHLLHDDDEGRKLAGGRVSTRTRAFAAYGMAVAAARSDRREVPEFVAHHIARALEDSRRTASSDLQAACVIALGIVPMGAEEGASSIRTRGRAAATAFEPRSRAAQAALLVRVLADDDRPEIARAHAPDALARLGEGAPTELRAEIARELGLILDRQEREDDGVVRGAVIGLGRLADCDSDAADVAMRAMLKRALDARDSHARLFALVALGQVAGRPGSSDDPSAVQSEVQSILMDRLVRGKSRERSWAAISLGILEHGRAATGQKASVPVRSALRRALHDAGAVDQAAAIAIGIGLTGDKGATKDLLKKLDDVSDPVARGHMAMALGLVGAEEASVPLRAILAKARFQPELLRETAIALALIGDADIETTLVAELANARSLSSQAGLARAIGFAGSLTSAEPLAEMLADSSLTSGARAFSAVALGMVLDRERTPWNAFLSIGVNYPSAPASLTDGKAGILDIL